MFKRFISIFGIFVVLFALGACSNKKVKNPIASVDSKQPDKILFDRAMDAMKTGKYDVARLTLQTLINTYPDSEYVARAKLAVGDSWYAEGGSAAMTQAENEYKDFITFFPNMLEAAEAQLKIANIHYREMEKPDRDFTHAMRAEEEYRNLITQFPDSKLVPEAKERLLEVQEVLAEREFRIARFYFMRESYPAAIARFQSLIDTYPLYSGADDALYMLGECYQHQADTFRAARAVPENVKANLVKEREDLAAKAFSRIITVYPATDRVGDAKKMLAAMHYPVPTPTPAEIAESKKIEASRGDPGFRDKFMASLHKGPSENIARAPKAGEPTLVDPPQTSAVTLTKNLTEEILKATAAERTGGNSVTTQAATGTGTPPPSEAAPSSSGSEGAGVEIVQPPQGSQPPDPNAIPELTPITDGSKPPESTQPATPPPQLNEVQTGDSSAASSSSTSSTAAGATGTDNSQTNQANQANQSNQQDKTDYSTSKQKKKKGLRKMIPF